MQNTNTQAVAVKEEKTVVEFTPFGSEDSIKMTISIVKNMIAIPTKSKKLPSDNECMKFMMLCRARRLNPWEGDAFLQGYDGKDGPQFSLITAHQAFLKRAEVHPEYDGMKSGVIVEDKSGKMVDRISDFTHEGDALLGGWAIVYFKTRKIPTERRLKLSTFNQGFGRWQKDAAGMIVKCAEADALRSSFPTQMGGMYMREEVVVESTPDNRFKAARPVSNVVVASVPSNDQSPDPEPASEDPSINTAPEPETTPEPTDDDGSQELEPVAESAPVTTKKATTKPAEATTVAEPAAELSPVEKLRGLLGGVKVPEAAFVSWACARYKLSPVSDLDELAEIAPNRVKNAGANFTALIAEYKPTTN